MSDVKAKDVIQLGVEYLKSRVLKAVIRSHGRLIARHEIEKQWKEANKSDNK